MCMHETGEGTIQSRGQKGGKDHPELGLIG